MERQKINMDYREFIPWMIEEYLKKGHTSTLPLQGFSMRPFLEDGRDMALLRYADDTNNIKVGDPVLAEIRPGHFVLHRIVAIDGQEVTLLGDGNLTPEHCRRENIKAFVLGFYRKGRNTPDLIDSTKWKVYSWWWMRLRPIRRYLLFIYRHLFVRLK